MEITLTELANKIGVSKSAINQKINQEEKEKYFKKEGNKFMVTDEGQKAIKSKFRKPLKNENNQQELLDTLLKENSVKNEQLTKKDEQLEKMQKLLDQQQQLHLQANQRIEMLEKQLSLEEPKTNSQSDVVAKEEFEKLEENRKQLLENIKYQTEQANALKAQHAEDEKINEELFNELKRMKEKKWFQFWK